MCAVIQFTIPPIRPTCVGLYTMYRFVNTCTEASLCCTHRSNGLNNSMNASTFRKFDVLAVVTVKNAFFWDFTQYY